MESDAIRKLLAEATPGPWAVGNFVIGPRAAIGFKRHIVEMLWHDDTGKADVSLIAAAPDLAAEVLRLRDRLIAEEEAKIRLAYRAAEEIGKLREALAFYANLENWRMGGQLDPNSPKFRGGDIARAALKEIADGQ